jgi:SWI/SNF-related matrix-associated actin-dependent regulator 1 of chromatin subfamily A
MLRCAIRRGQVTAAAGRIISSKIRARRERMAPKRGKAAPASPFEAALEHAEALEQRAERRRGAEAAAGHEAASAAFEQALSLAAGAPPARVAEAHFGLAEALQAGAGALQAAAAALPDAEATASAEAGAAARAARLLELSVQHYRLVPGAAMGMRGDAAVNCGNALAAWAEALPAAEAARADALLADAEAAYAAALAAEEDAAAAGNLGDTLAQRGALHAEAGRSDEARALFARAHAAHGRACELSSSEAGDDLPGLLANWGTALAAAAAAAPDVPSALALLDEAAARLARAAEFERGDPAPLASLGDTLVARAERLREAGAPPADVAAALEQALSHYTLALHLRRADGDALLGAAEARAAAARLLDSRGGDGEAAQAAWAAACDAYARALAAPEALGGFAARSAARYNHVCCLARAGRRSEAAALLSALVAAGGASAAEAAADADLNGLLS